MRSGSLSRSFKRRLVRLRKTWRDILFRAICAFTLTTLAISFCWNHSDNAQEYKPKATTEEKRIEADENIARYTLWLDVLTGALAISTLGLWIVTWGGLNSQSRDMKKSLRISQIAANAARDSAKTIPTLERAFVFIETMVAVVAWPGIKVQYDADRKEISRGFSGHQSSVRISISNKGRTPANIHKIVAFAEFRDGVPTDEDTGRIVESDKSENREIMIVIGADKVGDELAIGTFNNLTVDSSDAYANKTYHLYCWGQIDYRDIFGEIHTTYFCRRNVHRAYQTQTFDPVGGFDRNRAE